VSDEFYSDEEIALFRLQLKNGHRLAREAFDRYTRKMSREDIRDADEALRRSTTFQYDIES